MTKQPSVTSLDVIGRPFVFVQRPLINPSEFAKALRERGVYLSVDDLELLHRTRLLSPLYAVRRPRWDVNQRLRATDFKDLYERRTWSVPSRGPELAEDFAAGLVTDGADLRFRAWATDEVRTEFGAVRRREYLYSRYQAISGKWLAEAVPLMLRSRRELPKWDRIRLRHIRRRAERDRTLVPVLTALEPAYLPSISRTYRFTAHDVPDERERFLSSFDPVALLDDIGWTTDELYQAASRLILDADGLDPLAEWLPLLRLVRPDRWDKLRGGALLAIDLRVGGEMLLMYLEALQEKRAAPPFPSIPKLEARTQHAPPGGRCRLGRRPHDLRALSVSGSAARARRRDRDDDRSARDGAARHPNARLVHPAHRLRRRDARSRAARQLRRIAQAWA